MQRLNDAPIIEQTKDHQMKLLMIALWKAVGHKVQAITPTDIAAFNEAHHGQAIMFLHGHKDSIDVGVVTPQRAAELAAHHAATTSKERH